MKNQVFLVLTLIIAFSVYIGANESQKVSAPNIINVGADGQFTDIQRAIDYARSGEIIQIAEGFYEISGSLMMENKSDITIRGTGVVDIIGLTYVHSLWLKNCRDIVIENLHLVHQMGAEYVTCEGANVLRLEDCDDITIRHNELNGCGNIGVYALNCRKIEIIKNYIHSNTSAGIRIEGWHVEPELIIISENRIINNSIVPVDFLGKTVYTDIEAPGLIMENNSIYSGR